MPPVTNPFAAINGSLPPLIPKPQDLGAPPANATLPADSALPAFPSSAAPKVSLAAFDPKTASPEELATHPLVSALRKDEEKDENPWGTPQNHPGFWGKVGHALSVATGGPNRREFQEMGLQKNLQALLDSQTRNNYENTDAAHTAAETQALSEPSKGATKPYTVQTNEGVLQWNPGNNSWSPVKVGGDTAMPYAKPSATASHFQHISGTSNGKQVFGNYDPQSGHVTDLQGNVLSDFEPADKALQGVLGQYAPVRLLQGLLNTAYNENPALLPIVGKLASQIMGQYGVNPGEAQSALGAAPEGQPENDEGSPIGLRMPGAPTAASRSRGQFAADVLPTMYDAGNEVDALGDKIGPFMGRISDLLTGKIGAYGPEFSALQTDLHNIATGWGRLHGNSVETMKQFYDDLNASKDPANLKAKLERYEKQAEIYDRRGQGKPQAKDAPHTSSSGGTPTPPKGATQVGVDTKGNVVGWVVNGKWVNAGGAK